MHIPAAVAAVLDCLDVRAPVDLDERLPRLDQPSGDEAALAESVRPVPPAHGGWLALDVEGRETLTRADERVGQLEMAVESRGGTRRGRDPSIELVPQVPPGFEAGGGDALGQLGVGEPHAGAGLVPEAERVMGRAKCPAPFADDPLLPLVQRIAQDHVGRDRARPAPVQPADDRAGAGPLGARDARVAEPPRPGPAAGQSHRPGDAVVGLVVVHRPHQRELVGASGQVRQQLADPQPGDPGRDRHERPPILDRGVRFHIKRVELARRPPEPEQDDRSGLAAGRAGRGAEGQVIGERQPQRADRPDAQERPPGNPPAGSILLPSDPQHGSDPLERRR